MVQSSVILVAHLKVETPLWDIIVPTPRDGQGAEP